MLKNKARFVSLLMSIAILLSSFAGMTMNTASAENINVDEALLLAKTYVDSKKNDVTLSGLLEAFKASIPDATLAESDFYVKHSVPGVKDDAKNYKLDITGSNGAVTAVFDVNGTKVGFSRSFGYETETIHIEKTAIVGTSKGFSYNGKNVTGYTGDADKIVFPSGYAGTMLPVSDFSSINNVKVVIINNTKSALLVKQGFYNWDGLIAVQISGDSSHYFFTQKGSGVNENEKIFAECDSLKYVKLPDVTKAAEWSTGYLPYRGFENSIKLENINMPALVQSSKTQNHKIQQSTFQRTAVRDFVFPDFAAGLDNEVFAGATYGEGTRNIHFYKDNMTYLRAAALISASVRNADSSLSEQELTEAAVNAVTGSFDASEFAGKIKFTYSEKEYDYATERVLTLKYDGVEIPVATTCSKTLESLGVAGYNLSPEFDASKEEYSISVPNNVTSIDVNAVASTGATVTSIVGNDSIQVGNNKVTVSVLTADGLTITYTINVYRAEPLDENYAVFSKLVHDYVASKKNASTADGLLAYINDSVADAQIDTENDYYIKHSVNGVKDNTKDYPLNIEGSDGAVSVIISYNGKRYGITAPFAHETEEIKITKTAIVGKSEGFTYDSDDNVTDYTGTADKIVFPKGYAGTMKQISDKSSVNNVKVVIYNNGIPMYRNAFSEWQGLIAVQMDNGADTMQLAATVNESDKEAYMFSDCPNLKYFKFPKTTRSNGHYWYDMFPSHYLENCVNLETVIMPETVTSGSYSSYGYRTFYKTAVREIVWPSYSKNVTDKYEATAQSTIPNGTRNILNRSDKMTFVHAMALAAAGVNELSVKSTLEDAVNKANQSIIGTDDKDDVIKQLKYSVDGEWKNTDNTVGGTLVVTDGTETSLIEFSASKTLKDIDIGNRLSPSFSPDILNYTAEIITEDVNVSAVTAEGAKITSITGNTGFEIDVPKDIVISVLNTDGNTINYTITVTRRNLTALDDALIDRVQKYAESFVAHNSTSREDFAAYLSDYEQDLAISIRLIDYYMYEAIQGAREVDTILVPGHDGYISARVSIGNSVDYRESVVTVKVLPDMKNYSFTADEIAKPEDFHLSEDGKTLEWFDGDAKKLVVPDGVQEIDLSWFSGEYPENVQVLILPESCTNLPSNLCYGMKNLEVCYLGNGIETLPTGTFMRCYKLQYVHLPEHLTTISTQAFKFAQTLPALYIPESVTAIGSEAFWICGIRNYTLSANIETINSYGISYPQGNAGIYAEPDAYSSEFKAELQAIMDGYQLNKHNVSVTVLSDKMTLAAMSSIHCSNTGHKLGSVLEIRAKESAKENIFEKVGLSSNSVYDWNLDMTFVECATRARFAVDHLLIEKDDKAENVEEAIINSFYSTKESVLTWIEPFNIANGRAKGKLRITQGTDVLDLVIDRPLYVPSAASRNLGLKKNNLKASYKGDNEDENEEIQEEIIETVNEEKPVEYATKTIASKKYGFEAKYTNGKGFPDGYYLDVLKIGSKNLSPSVLKALKNIPFVAYDVAILDEDDYIKEVEGILTVSLDVPKDFSGKHGKVYMLIDDEFYDMKAKYSDGKYAFDTDKLGVFIVTNYEVKVVKNTEVSYTALIIGLSVGGAVLVAAVVVFIILMKKRRKKR